MNIKPLLTAFITVSACMMLACAACGDTLNLSYINGKKTSVSLQGKSFSVPMEQGTAYTEDISRLVLLLCDKKGKEFQAELQNYLEFISALYISDGKFHKGIDSSGNFTEQEENPAHTGDAYAFWALCKGLEAMPKGTAENIEKIIEDTVKTKLKPGIEGGSFNRTESVHGITAPLWLVDGRSDSTSLYILALLDYAEKNGGDEIRKLISGYAEAVKIFSDSNPAEFPYCAHYESTGNIQLRTIANNRQIAALALAGKYLNNKSFIDSSEKEANNLYIHLLASYGPICGMAPAPVIYPQTAECAEVMTYNLIKLAEVTSREQYYVLAGLSAAWFQGANSAGKPLYNRQTGKMESMLTEKGIAESGNSLKDSIEALSALQLADGAKSRDYIAYTQDTPSHSFIVLQAEEGKPVKKDYELRSFTYPGGTEGQLVDIKRENAFWIRFAIEEENDYEFHLVYLKKPGISLGTSIDMRIDGDKIYSVPLGGSPDIEYMAMQEVLEPRPLLPGLHSMGIRFSGLLLRTPATLDCVVLQPLTEWRVFTAPGKQQAAALIKSFRKEAYTFELSRLESKNFFANTVKIYDNNGKLLQSTEGASIKLPPYGYAVAEGKSK